jgi:hypothetical protein
MLSGHFYHKKFRKAVATFGTMFNNIYVIRTNGSTGETLSQLKVPLTYAPKRKFLDRLTQQPNLDTDTQVAVKLPRMSFEITDIFYDPARQLSKNNSYTQSGSSINVRNQFYSYVPYTIGFQLNIYTKIQDDALQIVEQILPTFNPQYTLTMKPFTDHPEIKEDVPITITGVSFLDDYEGALESRRTIVYTLTFEMKLNIYGPIADQAVIRKANVNTFDINSNQVGLLSVTPNPIDANPDSDYGFNEFFDDRYPFIDSSG